jgi:diguanylate cyclase (GGDEF)-like protein/PAS domain S-box-containing protein
MALFASLWAADHLRDARSAEAQRHQTTQVVASAELLFSVDLARTMVDLVVNDTAGIDSLAGYRPLVDSQMEVQARLIRDTAARVQQLATATVEERQRVTAMLAAVDQLQRVALTTGQTPRIIFSRASLTALDRASKVIETEVLKMRVDDHSIGGLLALAELQRNALREGSITMAFGYTREPRGRARVHEAAAAVTSTARTTAAIVPQDLRTELAALTDPDATAEWHSFQNHVLRGDPVSLMDGLPLVIGRTSVVARAKETYGQRLTASATARAEAARQGFVIALWLAGGLFIGTLVMAFLAMRPARRRLRRLERQAVRIGAGDLSIEPLAVTGRDETALLAQSFDLMAGTLTSLQQRMDALADGTEDDTAAVPVPGRIGESIERSVARLSQMTSTLRLNEELARLTVDAAVEAIWILDETWGIVSANPAAAAMSGRDPLTGDGLSEFLTIRDTSTAFDGLNELTNVDGQIHRPDGTSIDVLVSTRRVAPTGGAKRWMVFVRDISERKQLEARLDWEATHDALTGLPNRLALTRLLTNARPTIDEPLTAVFVDLDGFKRVNDAMGHRAGDDLLREAAVRLRTVVRASDTVTRLGGDEFVVLMHDHASEADVDGMIVRLLAELARPFELRGTPTHLSASIGIATTTGDTEPTDVIRLADLAMYQAKQGGPGSAARYDASMHERVARRVEVEEALRQAIGNDELTPYFQPIVSANDNRLTRIEMLARWHRAGIGQVSPSEFIPLAEETGMVTDIGRWGLRCAAALAVKLRASIPDFDVPIAVNISGVHIVRGDVVADVDAALLEAGCEARWLSVELTETYLLDEAVERVNVTLQRLVERGVGLSIDDFGTGYSSLTYLRRIPADVVKVDQSFVAASDTPGADQRIIGLVTTLAHTLGMRVVAEGVETREQLRRVRDAGCDEVQGYLIARPMDAAALAAWLVSQDAARLHLSKYLAATNVDYAL